MKTRKTLSEIIQTMEKSRPGKVLLCPLAMIAFLFQLLVKLKAYLYRTGLLKADELNCRVICVGNITSGGTGKTPAVQLLARRMQRQGLKVVIISRGYKGSLRGKLAVVADEEQVLRQPKEVGDEPYLLARHLPGIPIVVAKKRWRAGIYACARFDPQVIILDDGYQHQKLARQVNIMVIDATNPFGNYRLIPRGILREPLPALARAQVFLLTKTDLAQDSSSLIKTLKHYNPEAPIITSTHQPVSLTSWGTGKEHPLGWLKRRRVVCFCGIGNPLSFVKTIACLGAQIEGYINYTDHYAYKPDELKRLAEEAVKSGAEALITTEKDGVRINDYNHETLPLLILNIELKVTSEQQLGEKMWELIVGEVNKTAPL